MKIDLEHDQRLNQFINFTNETGKLKSVLRQTFLADSNRTENSAEHSWHLIILALTLEEYSNVPINIAKVIKMLSIHDLAEIYAGDTFLYDNDQRKDAEKREEKEMKDLLSILPKNSKKEEFAELWQEFTSGQSPEALFARALDRFQPFLEQLKNQGESWQRNEITLERALQKNEHIKYGSTKLWNTYQILANQADERGYFYKKK